MKIKFDEFTPVFLQIIDYIKIEIITGNKKLGERVLSVRELAREFEVNPNTVQKAYQELEKEGLLRSERGSGNYITEDLENIMNAKIEMSEKVVTDFTNKMNQYGYSADEIIEIIHKHLGRVE